MRRVLVPLDGSRFAEAILADARLLAGSTGLLVLLHTSISDRAHHERGAPGPGLSEDEEDAYLQRVMEDLATQGVKSQPYQLAASDFAPAIELAVREYGVDMIACAIHGLGRLSRFGISDVGWRSLVHSPVPVLLRHVDEDAPPFEPADLNARPSIMVPLDGSTFAESALQLADDLGRDWNAPILLTQVVNRLPFAIAPDGTSTRYIVRQELVHARAYLQELVEWFSVPVQTKVLLAHTVSDALVQLAAEERVTHVILSSHGRSGLSRLILGSVAAGLVSHLHCAVVVVPANSLEATQPWLELAAMPPGVS